MIKRKQFRRGANSANPKSLFEVLGLDKSNDPNYKLNPSFMSSGRAGRDGPQYILKTQDEIAESFLQPNVPINLQGTSVDEYMANYNKGELNNLNLNAINSIFTGNQITEENIKKTVEEENNNLNKHTGLGNMLARLGGGQIATEEERAAATPELRELYNQQRLAARNRGIGQMLFALSDAFACRDIVGRALERQQAMLPEEKSAREQINEELLRVYRVLEEVGGDPSKLPPYEKAIYNTRIANQTGYIFPPSPSDNNENEVVDKADLLVNTYLQPS